MPSAMHGFNVSFDKRPSKNDVTFPGSKPKQKSKPSNSTKIDKKSFRKQ